MGWSFRIGICASQDEIPICMTAIGNPHFLTIQNVVVAFFLSFGFDIGYIRSCSRLSDTISLFNLNIHIYIYSIVVPSKEWTVF